MLIGEFIREKTINMTIWKRVRLTLSFFLDLLNASTVGLVNAGYMKGSSEGGERNNSDKGKTQNEKARVDRTSCLERTNQRIVFTKDNFLLSIAGANLFKNVLQIFCIDIFIEAIV